MVEIKSKNNFHIEHECSLVVFKNIKGCQYGIEKALIF